MNEHQNENNCSICGSFSQLAKANKSIKTGSYLYRSWCITCEKERKTNWRILNKDKHNLKSKQWVEINKEKRLEIQKKYREKNKETVLASIKSWKINNKDKVCVTNSLRRKRIKIATPSSCTELDYLFFAEIYHIAKLRGLEVDHIIPLNNVNVCGLHIPENLQLLTKLDNARKSNKL